MKSISKGLCVYGTFLIIVGLIGYLSNPEKAKTALLSGGTFGALNIALGWLGSRGWKRSIPIALVVCLLLGGVFTWRTIVSWMAHAEGQPDKLVPAVLISSMLMATVVMIMLLVRSRKAVVTRET
jgi:uncharacterized membrane protein (UPF0136 family)